MRRISLPSLRRHSLRHRLESLEARLAPAIFSVTNLLDTGAGSLRTAVEQSNFSFGTDVITIDVSGTISLTSGELTISDSVQILGPGAGVATVDGTANSRIFNINDASPTFGTLHVAISGLALTNGNAGAGNGGAINVNSNELVLAEVIINASSASRGGGIFAGNDGALTMDRCTIAGNNANNGGGGIYLDSDAIGSIRDSVVDGNNSPFGSGGGIHLRFGGSLTIERTTISNNSVGGPSTFSDGGGIYCVDFGTLVVRDSTVSGNSAASDGGGIYAGTTDFLLENSTVSGNTAGYGGGLYLSAGSVGIIQGGIYYAPAVIRHATIAGNAAVGDFSPGYGGGIVTGRDVDIDNSIIALNTAGTDPDLRTFSSTFFLNYSLVSNVGSAKIDPAGVGNIFGKAPLLGPLQFNGGPTQTHALLTGSPGINQGDPSFATSSTPVNDQRGPGYPRLLGPHLDMGAVEFDRGIVTGTVFTDLNGNSVRDMGETGRPDVFVFLDANGDAIPDCDEPFTLTDANGQYSLTAVPGFVYQLIAVNPAGFHRTLTPPMAGNIVTVPGGSLTGLDFGVQADTGIVVIDAKGTDAAGIQSFVDSYRTLLGPLNPNVAGTQNGGNGRREINWDGVPDKFSAPNLLPSDFFNVNSPRGVVFNNASFEVSNNTAPPFVEFNPAYNFKTFSAPRLFTAVSANSFDINFFVPGTTQFATVASFGAVFSDVDSPVATTLEFFDATGTFLGVFSPQMGADGLSFLGVSFTDGRRIARIRVTAGNAVIGTTDNCFNPDVVVLDDFLYGEPVAVPIVVPTAPVEIFAVGPGESTLSIVRVYDAAGVLRATFDAYPNFAGGVHVATGDVTGDGVEDLVTGAGPGGSPHVQVFDGALLLQGIVRRMPNALGSYYAYDPVFRGGVFVATGDINGDGRVDVITGAGPGGGPHVISWSGANAFIVQSFYAYAPTFSGGVTVAGGDLDNNGVAEIITGVSSAGAPHVRAFDASGTVVRNFYAFAQDFHGGVFVASGDVTGDGNDDIVVGAGFCGSPLVKVFDGETNALVTQFFAFATAFLGGVRVAVANLDDDAADEILVGAGPDGGPHVRGVNLDQSQVLSFFAYDPSYTGGVFVG